MARRLLLARYRLRLARYSIKASICLAMLGRPAASAVRILPPARMMHAGGFPPRIVLTFDFGRSQRAKGMAGPDVRIVRHYSPRAGPPLATCAIGVQRVSSENRHANQGEYGCCGLDHRSASC